MDWQYNLNDILGLLEDFYYATGFPIALFDKDFQELLVCPTRLSSFCKTVRTNSALNQACRQCDYQAFAQCKNHTGPLVYQCHGGLTEILVPICAPSMTIGYLMCGQFYGEDSQLGNWDQVWTYFGRDDIPEDALYTAYHARLPVSTVQITALTSMISMMAQHIYHSEMISLNTATLSYQIDQYILAHLKEEIHVTQLCQTFRCGKTTFYKIINDIYGVGIMTHIRRLRVHKAKELLSSTDLQISEIASIVGMDDYNYFTKVFKREAKCTPREYRKNRIATTQA